MSHYPYRAYFRQLFKYKVNGVAEGESTGFLHEEVYEGDPLLSMPTRIAHTKQSAIVEFIGPCLLEPFTTPAFMQANIDARITLNRSEAAFYMIQGDDNQDAAYLFEITKIALICPMVTLTDSLQPLMANLCDTSPARYKFLHYDIRTFTIPAQSSIVNLPKIYNYKTPSRLLMCFYEQDTFIGSKKKTPYHTADNTDLRLRKLSLIHNGLVAREFTPTVANNNYTEAFLAFTRFAKCESTPFCIDLDRYIEGSTYFAADLLENCDSPERVSCLCQATWGWRSISKNQQRSRIFSS